MPPRTREYINSLPVSKGVPLSDKFPRASNLAVDLLEKLLAFNPDNRVTAAEALQHPYLKRYHDEADEPTVLPIPPGLFSFDESKDSLTREQLKGLIYNEVMR